MPHTDQDAAYEGVLLHEVLRAAGVQFEDPAKPGKKLPAALRTAYVLVEAADGYQVVFSVPELDPGLGGRDVLLASRLNGKPLDEKVGPYQVIVPGSDLHGRWIRQVTRILVQSATRLRPAVGVARHAPQTAKELPGKVFLVGVGPGDPGLISVKAGAAVKRADVVFCFSWMKDEAGALRAAGCGRGRVAAFDGRPVLRAGPENSAELRQRVQQTNEALAKLKPVQAAVAEGKIVAFADNGDPTMFSPWGWLPEQLAAFRPVVIPGMSSSMPPMQCCSEASPGRAPASFPPAAIWALPTPTAG